MVQATPNSSAINNDRSDLERAKFNVNTDGTSAIFTTTAPVQTGQILSGVAATGAGTAITMTGKGVNYVSITASAVTTGATITIEGTIDGTNYGKVPIPTNVVAAGIALANNIMTISANGTYIVGPIIGPFSKLRLNIPTRTDGTYTAYFGSA
jgi:hypothetical protein